MENITLTIDRMTVICPKGSSIFDVARGNGIPIPHLCYHHSLKPFGACRLCLVEEETSGRLMASCVTPAEQGMILLTNTPRIIKHRRNIVRLMIAEHPESCIVCDKGNRCQLRQIAAKLGVGETDLYPMPNYKMLEAANPFIIRDLSKCILCGKCIRADHELVVVGAIDYSLRGFVSRPVTAHDFPLERSSCTFCGTCVSICPTGALSPKSQFIGTPERESVSICGFCGVGCSLSVGVHDEKVVDVRPAHIRKSVNDATLCARGHFAHDFLNSDDRLIQPLIRKEGEQVPVAWDEAMKIVSDRFLEIQNKSGPQSLAFLGSSKCTNEENYLFQKIARVIFNTNNVDNGGYMTGRHFLSMIESRTDPVGRFNFFAGPLDGLEKAEMVFVLGADPDHLTPVATYYLKRGAKNGVPILFVHPKRTELVNFCSMWLSHSKEGNRKKNDLNRFYLELINGLTALLLEKESYDHSFIDRFTEGFSSYKESFSSVDLTAVSGVTGIDAEHLSDAATLIDGKKIAFVIGNEFFNQKYNSLSMDALLNLAVMTGSIGYEGAGFYLLAAENNLVGAWDMGTVPDALPGRYSLTDLSARKRWEDTWKAPIPLDIGLNMVQMIKAAEDKKLKAMYIMGENPLRSLPQHDRIAKALNNLDFIVVQDILESETTRIADVVLPGAAFSEKDGSFTNMEGHIQTFSAVVPPPAGVKSDLEILSLFAEKTGYNENDNTSEKVREEISSVIPIYSKSGGDRRSIWIKEIDKRKDSLSRGKGSPIQFSKICSIKEEPQDNEYPLTALLGNLRYHLGSGTRTTKSYRISKFGANGEIKISADDGQKFGLSNGDIVRLVSRHGSLERKIQIEKDLNAGTIYVPLAVNKNDAINLIELSDLIDSESDSWNSCRVKMEKV